ncbi:hypothetical protein [Amycolatopsis thermophila]|uniref:Uncharacterized protein n=1 Tax=Amycolatopsis thermophila TaxID=206084 RepID=A0ABU0ETG4_9PSEU|nr:hypothetical protein [Amycolatopsis thermophila]MDQ0378599.1 hypothetical protein [Amycolatopsis thermophila]
MSTVTRTVRVSGPCRKCGQLNYRDLTKSGPRGAVGIVAASATCGVKGCGGTAHMTGHVTF